MYQVTVVTDAKEYVLHDLRDDNLRLLNPQIEMTVGRTGIFTFTIPPNHENKDKIRPLSSEIYVYDNKRILYCGRLMNSEKDFYNTGRATCEGEMAYLLDSIQRPYEFTGSAYDFLHRSSVSTIAR